MESLKLPGRKRKTERKISEEELEGELRHLKTLGLESPRGRREVESLYELGSTGSGKSSLTGSHAAGVQSSQAGPEMGNRVLPISKVGEVPRVKIRPIESDKKSLELGVGLTYPNKSGHGYSLEVRVPKMAVKATGLKPGMDLFYRVDDNKVIFEKERRELSEGEVKVSKRGYGQTLGITMPKVVLERTGIDETSLLQIKIHGTAYFIVEKVVNQELTRVLRRELAGIA